MILKRLSVLKYLDDIKTIFVRIWLRDVEWKTARFLPGEFDVIG